MLWERISNEFKSMFLPKGINRSISKVYCGKSPVVNLFYLLTTVFRHRFDDFLFECLTANDRSCGCPFPEYSTFFITLLLQYWTKCNGFSVFCCKTVLEIIFTSTLTIKLYLKLFFRAD